MSLQIFCNRSLPRNLKRSEQLFVILFDLWVKVMNNNIGQEFETILGEENTSMGNGKSSFYV